MRESSCLQGTSQKKMSYSFFLREANNFKYFLKTGIAAGNFLIKYVKNDGTFLINKRKRHLFMKEIYFDEIFVIISLPSCYRINLYIRKPIKISKVLCNK